jgi:21S rRNA (uridine2791-2'-O)-methyltransferase
MRHLPSSMLSRRVFEQLTDSLLLGSACKLSAAGCLAQRQSIHLVTVPTRQASSSSSTRWKSRQGKDAFAREARVQGLKSRAAFKLLEVTETGCAVIKS